MSKELEALNVLYKIALNTNRHYQKKDKETDDYKERVEFHKNIIETALKRLEEHDKIFKKYDINDIWLEPSLFVIKKHFPLDTETQLNKLKALEIINKKNVCIVTLKDSDSLEEYNDVICYHKVRSMTFEKPKSLTQEEFDLVKEVLL